MRWLAVVMSGLSLTGCASLMNGTRQDVAVDSSPANAECRISDQQTIRTPAVVSLARAHRHSITCRLPGYQPARAALGLRASAWLWGDIVCLGPIGLLIDAASGGANRIDPEQVRLTLRPNPRGVAIDSATAYGQMLAEYAARKDDAADFHKQLTGVEQKELEGYVLAHKGNASGLSLRFMIDPKLPAKEQDFISWFLQSFSDRTPVKPGLENRPFADWMKP
jgi:hypothetical protein